MKSFGLNADFLHESNISFHFVPLVQVRCHEGLLEWKTWDATFIYKSAQNDKENGWRGKGNNSSVTYFYFLHQIHIVKRVFSLRRPRESLSCRRKSKPWISVHWLDALVTVKQLFFMQNNWETILKTMLVIVTFKTNSTRYRFVSWISFLVLFKMFIFGFLLFPPFSKTDSILKIDGPVIATIDRTVLILFWLLFYFLLQIYVNLKDYDTKLYQNVDDMDA